MSFSVALTFQRENFFTPLRQSIFFSKGCLTWARDQQCYLEVIFVRAKLCESSVTNLIYCAIFLQSRPISNQSIPSLAFYKLPPYKILFRIKLIKSLSVHWFRMWNILDWVLCCQFNNFENFLARSMTGKFCYWADFVRSVKSWNPYCFLINCLIKS